MSAESIVNYADIFYAGSKREVLLALALLCGESRFSGITQLVGDKAKSTIEYNLKILEREGLVTRSDSGIIRLLYRTPLCLLVECTGVDYAYFGLLGERGAREESETGTALSVLRSQWEIQPKKITVLTTHRAAAAWRSSPKLDIEWILVDDEDISDVGRIFEKVEPKTRELAASYRLIMDCTSATKPATIAFYKLSLKYYAPLIYLYEQSKKLTWITSREDLERQVFGDKAIECKTLIEKLRQRKRDK